LISFVASMGEDEVVVAVDVDDGGDREMDAEVGGDAGDEFDEVDDAAGVGALR